MKRYTTILISVMVSVAAMFSVSCVHDLDVTPIDPDIQLPEDVLNSVGAYQQLLAKCYGGLSVSASEGPDSDPDISGIDGGYGQYMRALFHLQTLTTDEASCVWNDQTIKSLHGLGWTTSDVFVTAMFSRIYYQIGLCNEFIRRANAAPEEFKGEEMDYMIAQARALRALSYYHAVDLFGNVPFATEANTVGATGPDQISRYDLYLWLVDEIAGENGFREDLHPAAGTEYGRCSQEFATMLLAKLYLNAEVFTASDDPLYGGSNRTPVSAWTECAEECRTIIGDYPISGVPYNWNFSADNNLSSEIIFAVQSDAVNIQTYGSTNFVIKGSIVSGNPAWQEALGTNDGWGGLVVTPQFLDLFDEDLDGRFLFTDGSEFGEEPHSREITDNADFSCGWCQMKFTNLKHDGSPADGQGGYPDTDYPIFRAADAYLMLAEAELRAGSIQQDGIDAFNAVRERAGLSPLSQVTLDDILDERAREMYWENTRRQDLIRFGLFTTDDYLWDWKGGSYAGNSVDDRFNLFPIPANEINSNGKLEQNPGY
ncbi:MAG TPA: RagB/SusD family nutrient uptake outer membrane protein [Candidatus Coprenecus pullistercoris]|nr:RagB/SusD family nutrient uptake outer membrane protein [Candidatus Coprenecus pullistercoris]